MNSTSTTNSSPWADWACPNTQSESDALTYYTLALAVFSSTSVLWAVISSISLACICERSSAAVPPPPPPRPVEISDDEEDENTGDGDLLIRDQRKKSRKTACVKANRLFLCLYAFAIHLHYAVYLQLWPHIATPNDPVKDLDSSDGGGAAQPAAYFVEFCPGLTITASTGLLFLVLLSFACLLSCRRALTAGVFFAACIEGALLSISIASRYSRHGVDGTTISQPVAVSAAVLGLFAGGVLCVLVIRFCGKGLIRIVDSKVTFVEALCVAVAVSPLFGSLSALLAGDAGGGTLDVINHLGLVDNRDFIAAITLSVSGFLAVIFSTGCVRFCSNEK